LTFRRGFKAEANRIALRMRQKMGLAPHDPLDPVALCALLDIELLRMSELACDCSAFTGGGQSVFSAVTVPCGHQTAIVHNDAHHPYRQNSNICHELAHCLLGHPCGPPLNEKRERIRDSSIEAEANYLSGTLLLTNEGAFYVLTQGLLPVAKERYGISGAMLNYRLRISGAGTIFKRATRT
jgi:hypothetical protein